MDGLRLETVAVPGVPAPLTLAIPIAHARAVVQPDRHRARALADVVTGLSPAASGDVFVDSTPVRSRRRSAHGGVRLVPADGGLPPHLTVLRTIVYGQCVAGRAPRDTAELEVRSTAHLYGLDDVLDRYPHEITVGRRRMAGLARALRWDPSAVVLEDARGTPTWGALLGLGRTHRVPGGVPPGPALLAGVATLLVTPVAARARDLDDEPVVLSTSAGARA